MGDGTSPEAKVRPKQPRAPSSHGEHKRRGTGRSLARSVSFHLNFDTKGSACQYSRERERERERERGEWIRAERLRQLLLSTRASSTQEQLKTHQVSCEKADEGDAGEQGHHDLDGGAPGLAVEVRKGEALGLCGGTSRKSKGVGIGQGKNSVEGAGSGRNSEV